jgi:hypothetical protein
MSDLIQVVAAVPVNKRDEARALATDADQVLHMGFMAVRTNVQGSSVVTHGWGAGELPPAVVAQMQAGAAAIGMEMSTTETSAEFATRLGLFTPVEPM